MRPEWRAGPCSRGTCVPVRPFLADFTPCDVVSTFWRAAHCASGRLAATGAAVGCTVRAVACAARTVAVRIDARCSAPAAAARPRMTRGERATVWASTLWRGWLGLRAPSFSGLGAPRPRCWRWWPLSTLASALFAATLPHRGCAMMFVVGHIPLPVQLFVKTTCGARDPPAHHRSIAAQ